MEDRVKIHRRGKRSGVERTQPQETGPDGHITRPHTPSAISQAIRAGKQRFTDIRVPILAIYAILHALGAGFDKLSDRQSSQVEADETATLGAIANAFRTGIHLHELCGCTQITMSFVERA
jgi:hypothetical protein